MFYATRETVLVFIQTNTIQYVLRERTLILLALDNGIHQTPAALPPLLPVVVAAKVIIYLIA